MLAAAQQHALMDSAAYYEARMLTASTFQKGRDLLRHALGLIPGTGLVLEFGVASGRSITRIAETVSLRQVYGFDSFDGLPEDWRTGITKGAFAGPLPAVPSNVTLIKGLFSDTLPAFAKQHTDPISFLHVDCDLYSSTADILDHLGDRLKPGSVILFDEYFNYPGWRQHEFKAFQEFVAKRSVAYRYEGFVPRDQQVCVVIE